MPPVETITVDELEEQFTGRTSTSADALGLEWSLVRLGVAEEEHFDPEYRGEQAVEQVGAFYNVVLGRIFIVDREGRGRDLDSGTLAHELVHYMQDREHDLERFLSEPPLLYDQLLAALSIIEGEASLYHAMFLAAVWGLDPHAQDYPRRFDELAASLEAAQKEETGPYLAAPRSFPYVHGARFVSSVWAMDGQASIAALFEDPLATTLEVLGEQSGTTAPAPPEPGPAGATLVAEEQLGAWMLYAMLARRGTNAALEYARSWRVDRLFVYLDGTSPAFVWQLELRTVPDAIRLENELRRRGSFVVIRQDVTLYATESLDGGGDWRDRVVAAFGL